MVADMGKQSTFPLYDRILEGELESILRDLRDDGASYETIAVKLHDHDVRVAHTTVRRWCQDLGIEQQKQAS